MTQAALLLPDDECASCIVSLGLCERHKRDVLPQLARNVGWLKLMGQPHLCERAECGAHLLCAHGGEAPRPRCACHPCEQKRAEHKAAKRERSKAEAAAIEKAKRRSARKIARSQRRGFYGLARAIMLAR